MSKYNALWEYVQKTGKESFVLIFEEQERIQPFSRQAIVTKIRI